MADGFSVSVVGGAAILNALKNYGTPGRQAVAAAMYERMQPIINRAKRIVPVDQGILESSGYVETPVLTPTGVEIKIGFGNAATQYALIQHEDLTFHHPNGRQAKYLETPINEAMASFAGDVGASVKRRLGIG